MDRWLSDGKFGVKIRKVYWYDTTILAYPTFFSRVIECKF